MTTFKLKNSKIIKSDNRITLDAKHNEMLSKFKKYKKTKKELENKLLDLENKYKNDILKESDLNIKIQNIYLEEEIKEVKNKIEKITKNEEERKYYLDTSHILFEYYNTKELKNIKNKDIKTSLNNDNIILNFFNSKTESNTESKTESKTDSNIKK